MADSGNELAHAYARCFSTPSGKAVLADLKARSLDLAFPADVPTKELRHVEGKRYLVNFILIMVKRGKQQ